MRASTSPASRRATTDHQVPIRALTVVWDRPLALRAGRHQLVDHRSAAFRDPLLPGKGVVAGGSGVALMDRPFADFCQSRNGTRAAEP